MEAPIPITIIAWNAHGSRHRAFPNVARGIVFTHRHYVFIVLEPHVPQPEASSAAQTLGTFLRYNTCFVESPVGAYGHMDFLA